MGRRSRTHAGGPGPRWPRAGLSAAAPRPRLLPRPTDARAYSGATRCRSCADPRRRVGGCARLACTPSSSENVSVHCGVVKMSRTNWPAGPGVGSGARRHGAGREAAPHRDAGGCAPGPPPTVVRRHTARGHTGAAPAGPATVVRRHTAHTAAAPPGPHHRPACPTTTWTPGRRVEPCSERRSRPLPCARHVVAWRARPPHVLCSVASQLVRFRSW